MKTLAVINPKGGTGKTTVATHIAAAFAVSGLKTALADLDRQKNALAWLKQRPDTAASIKPLNWSRGREHAKIPRKIQRLIVDCPAQIRSSDLAEVIRTSDVLISPIQVSFFDEQAALRFLAKIAEIKEIRKGTAPVLAVANRLRPTDRKAKALEALFQTHGHSLATRIPERSIYPGLAGEGLSVFDLKTGAARKEQLNWMPLLETIEALWSENAES